MGRACVSDSENKNRVQGNPFFTDLLLSKAIPLKAYLDPDPLQTFLQALVTMLGVAGFCTERTTRSQPSRLDDFCKT